MSVFKTYLFLYGAAEATAAKAAAAKMLDFMMMEVGADQEMSILS